MQQRVIHILVYPFKTHLFTKSEKSYIVLTSGETTCAPQPAGPETTCHRLRMQVSKQVYN